MSRPMGQDPLAEFEQQWRSWTATPSSVHEDELRRDLPSRLPWRFRRPGQRVLLAAAAAVLIALVGLGLLQRSSRQRPDTGSRIAVVHPVDENVVLFISKNAEPVYIVLADASRGDTL